MADKSAVSGRNAAEYFEVRFAEVEALFDLPPYTSLAHGSDGPEVLIGRPGLLGRVEYVGLRGHEVFAPREANHPTLFVDVRGGTLVRRTFARDRSLTIHDKWVYVLRAEDPGAPATDVVAELSFRNGRFRPVSPGKCGEDPWSTTTKEAKALIILTSKFEPCDRMSLVVEMLSARPNTVETRSMVGKIENSVAFFV